MILFTPRSGSSWLTELLTRNEGFGQPEEWLNPDLIPETARELGVDNMKDYLDRITSVLRDSRTGVFGSQATFFQLEVARELVDVLRFFPVSSTRFFYLSRRDRVAQAISLYKAVASGHYHSTDGAGSRTSAVAYDPEAICYWHEHIREQEKGLEVFFREQSIDPIRLEYEDMIAMGPASLLDLMSVIIHGRRYRCQVSVPVDHHRLPSDQRETWIERLRHDSPNLFAVDAREAGDA